MLCCNGAGVTDPVLSDGAATYTPGISERRAGSSKFLHSGMKNTDAQSGASANVDSSRTYDAFGNLTGSSGSWSGPFGYAGGFGYQEDPDHGLRLLGHRYYDSSTGRFISKDPIGDGRNWYGYCGNNPSNNVDAAGLKAGKIFRLIRLIRRNGVGGMKPGAWLTNDQARRARSNGKNVIAARGTESQRRRAAEDLDNSVSGNTSWHDDAHPEGRDGTRNVGARPHYQNDKVEGHTFYGFAPLPILALIRQLIEFLDVTPIGLAMDAGELLGDAIDPYVDEAKRGYRHMRIGRWLGDDDD